MLATKNMACAKARKNALDDRSGYFGDLRTILIMDTHKAIPLFGLGSELIDPPQHVVAKLS